MTDAAREYGGYDGTPFSIEDAPSPEPDVLGMADRPEPRVKPGVCVPWEDKRAELPDIQGDEPLVQRVLGRPTTPGPTPTSGTACSRSDFFLFTRKERSKEKRMRA